MTLTKMEKEIKEIIFKYISPKDYQVFVFGSRAWGDNQKWSDFDVGIKGEKPVPFETLTLISGDLEDSDIPVKVDVVDFSTVSDKFKNFALKKIKLWNQE